MEDHKKKLTAEYEETHAKQLKEYEKGQNKLKMKADSLQAEKNVKLPKAWLKSKGIEK